MMSLLPTVTDVPSSTYDRADAAARQLVGQAFLVPLLKEVGNPLLRTAFLLLGQPKSVWSHHRSPDGRRLDDQTRFGSHCQSSPRHREQRTLKGGGHTLMATKLERLSSVLEAQHQAWSELENVLSIRRQALRTGDIEGVTKDSRREHVIAETLRQLDAERVELATALGASTIDDVLDQLRSE